MRSTIFALLASVLVGCGGGGDPGSPTKLTLTTFTATGPVNTQLVALQDGDGAWTVVSGTAGVYTATVHHDRFGLMVACSAATFSSVFTIYATPADGTSWYVDDCSDAGPAAATISGNITGAAAANSTRVINGFDFIDAPAGTTTYSLPTTAGPSKLFGEELVNDRPVKLTTVDTTVADGATVNFDLATGFAPETHTLSANGPINGASLSYRNVNSIAVLDFVASPFSDYRGVPASQLGNGLNRLTITGPISSTASQDVIRYFTTPTDQTITLPAPLQLPQQPSAVATPYPTATAELAVQAGTTLYGFDFSTTNQTTMASHDWFAEMTGSYVAAKFPGGTVSYTMPDLHALAGWQPGFQLETGTAIDFALDTTANTKVDIFNAVPPDQSAFHDGGEEKIANANGQLQAP